MIDETVFDEYIVLPDDICKRTIQFVDDVYPTNSDKYADRNQDDPESVRRQAITGKVGEWCAYFILRPYFPDMEPPDMRIYEKDEKSWDFDLTGQGLGFIVKSQERMRGGLPESWTFNFADKDGSGGRDKKVFDDPKPTSIVVMMRVDTTMMSGRVATGRIKAMVPAPALHLAKKMNGDDGHGLFRLPEREYLHEIKRTIHAWDLKEHEFMRRVPRIVSKKAKTPDNAELEV